MSRITLVLVGLALAASMASAFAAEGVNAETVTPAPGAQKTYFNFLGDYRSYYAEREPLCFTAITPASDGTTGLHLAFASNLPGLQAIEWAVEDEPFRPLADGSVFVRFDGKSEVAQRRTYRVRPVFEPAGEDRTYTIHINWMTRAAFAAAGGKRDVDIVKITSDPTINVGTNRPENWKTLRPSATEIEFAHRQWGHLLKDVTSDYEKARILTRALIDELRGCEGLPSAFIYSLPTFEKYNAIRSGRSKVACAQYSEIFSKACNAFGVVNRWGFINDNLRNDDVLVELGSSHLVTEIFDRDLNQWIFLDGRAQTLGTYLGEVGPLTLHEFFLFINQPNRRPHLNVVYYDVEHNRELTMPVDDCPKPFLSYRGWTKGFHTSLRREQ